MKRVFHYSFSLLLSALMLASCSSSFDITKRRYSRGYHIDPRNEAHAQQEKIIAIVMDERKPGKAAPSIIEDREEKIDGSMLECRLVSGTSIISSLSVNAPPSPSGQAVEKPIVKKMLLMKAKKMKKGAAAKDDGGVGANQLLALIICFLVGIIGIHRFYLGYYGIGVIQLLTLGACGIWTLIDFIRIITGDLKPKDGEYRKTFSDY